MRSGDEAVLLGPPRPLVGGIGEARGESIRAASIRTLRRWRAKPEGADGRFGPQHAPANALTEADRREVLHIVNSPEFRDLSPKQIVPRLANEERYIASESTIYRILREEGQLRHRGPARAPVARVVQRYVARRPNQVWSWDITYLRGPIRGTFYDTALVLKLVDDDTASRAEEPRHSNPRDAHEDVPFSMSIRGPLRPQPRFPSTPTTTPTPTPTPTPTSERYPSSRSLIARATIARGQRGAFT